jgi:hypothetical protein
MKETGLGSYLMAGFDMNNFNSLVFATTELV